MTKWHYTLELGPYPIKAYYAPSKKSWHRLLKKLKIKDEPYSKGAGQMATFYPEGRKNDPVCIITVNCKDMPTYQRAAIIAHECVHVYQELIERIGEHTPSVEFEAYTIQSLVSNVMWAWEDTFGNK